MRTLGSVSKEERPVVGKLINDLRDVIETALTEKTTAIVEKEKQERLKAEDIDL